MRLEACMSSTFWGILFSILIQVMGVAQVSAKSKAGKQPITSVIMKNGNTVNGLLLSENTNALIIKNQTSDTITILLSDISEIKELSGVYYQEVETDPINTTQKKPAAYNPLHTDFLQNIVALNLLDLLLGNISVSYERILEGGYFGVKFPVSVGISKDGTIGTVRQDKLVSGGFDLSCYLFGQGKARFFFGPGIEFGQYYYSVAKPNSASQSDATPLRIGYSAFFFNSGFMLQVTKEITFSTFIGIGKRADRSSDFYNYDMPPDNQNTFWNLGVDLAYRF